MFVTSVAIIVLIVEESEPFFQCLKTHMIQQGHIGHWWSNKVPK